MADLDNELLKNHPWTIIHLRLSSMRDGEKASTQKVGRGLLVHVPLYKDKKDVSYENKFLNEISPFKTMASNMIRDHILYNHTLYKCLFHKYLTSRPYPGMDSEAIEARMAASNLMNEYKINLLVMHHVGVKDSAVIIEEAVKRNIPYVVINHFSNERLSFISVREQIKKASGIGGVSNVGVPWWLRNQFVNLSDGIDTDLFRRDKAQPISMQTDVPIALLPARITPEKGQRDLMQACASLQKEGIKIKVALAGRSDSTEYVNSLKQFAQKSGIERYVLFLGDLPLLKIRDWYAASTVLVFPTYREGLGRVLLESQAMKLPVITYISGGTPEAIIHDKTGFLVRRGDVHELTNRLRELITDKSKRDEMKNAGRVYVEKHFSLKALAARHAQFYTKSA